MNKDTVRQVLIIVALILVIAINILANTLPLNGLTTGDISDRFDIYFVPAGYVFSIWSVIYLGLIAYGIYQALPAQKENPDLRSIGWPFLISCMANIVWLFLWHYEVFLFTLPAMVAILLSLIVIYLRLDIGRAQVSRGQLWAVHIPFSIYLGWITVATIANVTQLLFYIGWSGWGISPEIWTVIMLAAAVIISGVVSLSRADIAYSLVLIWALIGIAQKHTSTPTVANSAWIGAGLILIVLIIGVVGKFQRGKPLIDA
jgi:hypothetical protein